MRKQMLACGHMVDENRNGGTQNERRWCRQKTQNKEVCLCACPDPQICHFLRVPNTQSLEGAPSTHPPTHEKKKQTERKREGKKQKNKRSGRARMKQRERRERAKALV